MARSTVLEHTEISKKTLITKFLLFHIVPSYIEKHNVLKKQNPYQGLVVSFLITRLQKLEIAAWEIKVLSLYWTKILVWHSANS